MSRKTQAMVLGLAALALAAGLGSGGCGGREDWYAGIYDLSAVTPSADLRPAIEEALAALAGPEPQGPVVADLDRYQDLMLRVQRTQTREQAGDELYALWANQPTHVLWIELAVNYNYLLRRTAALDSMCARPELSDTTSAIEAFVTGRRRYLHGDRGENYRRAEARLAELDALQQVWLTMKLAVVDFDAGDPVGAVRRLLGVIPLARATGGSRLEISLWRSVARFLYRIDRLDDALCASVLATAQARKVGYDYRALQGRVQLASIMSSRREYEGALALFEECAADATERDFPWLISSSLDKAAAVSGVLGDHRRALELDRRNLDYSLAMNDSLLAPRKMVNLAYDFRVQGQLDSCRTYLARARRSPHRNATVLRSRSRIASIWSARYALHRTGRTRFCALKEATHYNGGTGEGPFLPIPSVRGTGIERAGLA